MKKKCIGMIVALAALAGSAYAGDNNYSERASAGNELVTPSGTGNETGGYFFSRNAKEGQTVTAALYDPSSPNEACPSCREYYAATPAMSPAAMAPAPATIAELR